MAASEQSQGQLAIAAYLSQVEKVFKTGKATEHSYRGALEQLLIHVDHNLKSAKLLFKV